MGSQSRITVREIAEDLDLGEATIYCMLDKGIIPALRHNRLWVISRSSYERWKLNLGNREKEKAS